MPKKKKSNLQIELGGSTWARTFLLETPHDLRHGISRKGATGESALGFLLAELEDEARRTLKANLPSGLTKDLDIEDLLWISRAPDVYFLTEKQENAAAVLMRAFSLRNLLMDLPDPKREISEKELGEKIALEAMQLSLAAVRGDFWSNLWPHLKRGAAALHGSRQGRTDNLNREIENLLAKRGPRLTASNAWAFLKTTINYDSVIQEVDDDNISWIDQRGRERTTNRKSFENRLSKIKKKISS